jgi:tetratricopeptide (TPR) repeat protein
VCLLIAAAGCQHQEWTVANSGPSSSGGNPPVPAPGQVKKAPAKPKELPPSALVAAGDWKVAEAFHPKTEPDRRQLICELAYADYEKALKSDPKCVPAIRGLARLYSGMHNLPLAIETYQKAIKLAPNNAALWYELGICHNSRKDWRPALECLDKATRLDPGNRAYTNTKGIVLAAAGRYDDSLNCFVRSNGEAMGYYRLAQTLEHLQQPELSRRYLEAAVQRDPSLATTIAMRSGGNDAANQAPPVVQQTAYQAPNDLPQQAVPAPVPQVISVAGSDAVNQTPQRPVILPPPPSIDVKYEQAKP